MICPRYDQDVSLGFDGCADPACPNQPAPFYTREVTRKELEVMFPVASPDATRSVIDAARALLKRLDAIDEDERVWAECESLRRALADFDNTTSTGDGR